MDSIRSSSDDIIRVLQAVFIDGKYATKAIQMVLKNRRELNETERELFSESIYGIIRYWRLLWYVLEREPSTTDHDLQELFKVYTLFNNKINPSENKENNNEKLNDWKQRISDAFSVRVLRESIPDWLDKKGDEELGKRWEPVISSLNQKPELYLRTNTLNITRDELLTIFEREGIYAESVKEIPDAVVITKKMNVFRLDSFQSGLFEVQDAASQMVSRLLAPDPGMIVIDACAGEGSKTLHLSALMQNKGRIIALDPQAWRLQELRRRAGRAGADNIETRLVDSSKVYKRLRGSADRLLLDVPCSGLGTLRRNPDIKWKLTPSDLERLRGLQQEILERYCGLLKENGRLVYATCSILPSEGENQINAFLDRHPDEYYLLKEQRYWPDIDKTDGFYMALIERRVCGQ